MAAQRAAWRMGERVSRIATGDRGTVDEVREHTIKIKWDSGATSYYRRDDLSNVLLKEPSQQ
jgi:putative component of toxin-antitoxin plasmid stabilization module